MLYRKKNICVVLLYVVICSNFFSCKPEIINGIQQSEGDVKKQENSLQQHTEIERKPTKEITFNDNRIEDNKIITTEKLIKKPVSKKPAKVQKKVKPKTKNKPSKIVKKGKFRFDQEEFDFGFIEVGEIVNHTFSFTNIGDAPINISNAVASCGCTTPVFPFLPIEPGEKGQILVRFNSKDRLGGQVATVTIYSDSDESEKELKLNGVIRSEIVNPAEFVDTTKND